jgi:hypothetical protein
MRTTALLSLFAFAALYCRADDFRLASHGVLSVNVPQGWNVKNRPAQGADGSEIGHAFSFQPDDARNVKCLLTFMYVEKTPDKAELRNTVLRMSERFVSGSVEKKPALNEFSLKSGYGAYCVFTDASLVGKPTKPGDYKVMAAGQVQPGDGVLGVASLFADEKDGKDFRAMLQIVNSLKLRQK